MALSRITVWSAGQVLTAADLNGEFNNVLSNPLSLISPTTGSINYANNQAVNFALENVSADPTPGNTGRIVFNTGKQQPQVDDGTVIRTIPALISTNITQGDLIVSASSGAGFFKPITIGNAGQALVVASSGGQVGWGTPAVASGGEYVVSGLTGSVTSSQAGSFAADWIKLRSSAGTATFQINATSSFTVNVGLVGVGGRDQAGQFASTFIHAYAISTGAGSTTPIGLLSSVAPPTGPTLPSSCSAWAYLGTFLYSSASTGFSRSMIASGSEMFYTSAVNIIAAGGSTAEATVDVKSIVPVNARSYTVSVPNLSGVVNGSGQSLITLSFRIVTSQQIRRLDANWQGLTAAGERIGGAAGDVKLPNVGQQYFYLLDQTQGTAPQTTHDITSYIIPNGDV